MLRIYFAKYVKFINWRKVRNYKASLFLEIVRKIQLNRIQKGFSNVKCFNLKTKEKIKILAKLIFYKVLS